MAGEISGKLAVDLLSLPPLIFRVIRRKLILSTLSDVYKDIKFPHIEIMSLLKEEGTLHITRICEKLQIAKAQMTHLIDKLVELGLLERNMDKTDRRTINITITKKGELFIEEHQKSIINALLDYMSGLSDEELKTLSFSLKNLRDILLKLQ